MEPILTAAGSIVTSAVEWIGEFASAIPSQPILLLPIGLLVAGVGVGFLGRLFHLR